MAQLVVIADDFTGACDTALQFVKRGIRSEVRVWSAEPWDEVAEKATALVFDAETRSLPTRQVSERTVAICDRIRKMKPGLIYKKIDSTVRGNIGAELRETIRILGSGLCLIAPAFPATGRTTVGGYQLVNGIPVSRSEAGSDPVTPVLRSYLPDLLGDLGTERIHVVGLDDVAGGVDEISRNLENLAPHIPVVLDAATDGDLESIAMAASRLSPRPLVCGSAGLAAHLPQAFGLHPETHIPLPNTEKNGPVLVVIASRASANQDQVARLCSRLSVYIHREPFEALRIADRASAEHIVFNILPRFKQGALDAVVLTVDQAPGSVSDLDGEAMLTTLGRISRGILDRTEVSGLILTGGWTAIHIVRELGAWGAEVCAEVEAGVPLSRLRGGAFDGLGVVTKAGGFGDSSTLVRATASLMEPTSNRIDAGSLEHTRARPRFRPLLAITMGDVCGIGPEVIAKALSKDDTYRLCKPLVIGQRSSLEEALRFASRRLSIRSVSSPSEGDYVSGAVDLLETGGLDPSGIQVGQVSPEAGKAAVEFVFRAADLAMSEEVDGVVTAPLNKEAMNKAGFTYAGHTELLTERTGAPTSRMMLAMENFRIVHVTTHVALRDILQLITVDRILKTFELAHQALLDLGVYRPKIAVAGINPHCGEGGMFGDEDSRIVAPAVERARTLGWDIVGPVSPDTVFFRAYQGAFDAVTAIYHDQGHIPMKLVGFAEAVNVTLGLPIVRTSVDHGTAFDIAGKGVADETNMISAIRLAARLAMGRKVRSERPGDRDS